MNNMLFLVLFDEVVAAFLLLLGSMLCLAAFTAASKIRRLVGPSASTVDDTSDNKLAVSLFRREGLVPAQML
jgi:hypothetical protein